MFFGLGAGPRPSPAGFRALTAQGYPSGTYGSQKFHRRESAIDAPAVLQAARTLLSGGQARVMMSLDEKAAALNGPILVLGASGFVGANLLRALLRRRSDVYGVASRLPAWRLDGIDGRNLRSCDLLVELNVRRLLEEIKPKIVFDCVAYGAYSFQEDSDLIYRTNFDRVRSLARQLAGLDCAYFHSGSSSEYGDNCSGPAETAFLEPNSHYAASKASVAAFLYYMGKKEGLRCANLRLYSVYGPMEDASRLIPAVVTNGCQGRYPPFADPETSRDFIYVDDVVEAYVDLANNLRREQFGESFNVGSARKTTIRDLAAAAKSVFQLADEPTFSSFANRKWDVKDWFADCRKIEAAVGWKAKTPLAEGLRATAEWMTSIPDHAEYERASKRHASEETFSISAIIACYKDNLAIPVMHRRLTDAFRKIGVDYEIIFVNDCSPDDSEEVIRAITESDSRVTGISHSRNFGSQSAFKSGLEMSTKRACVLLDGDLQDPPELIEEFYKKWREGFDVVYGVRVKREAPFYMQVAYRAFYWVFNKFSYVPIPRDAGDFSLMDRRVVDRLIAFPERDLFFRGIRAFAGFRQAGVEYVRPERMFGRSTNNLLKNIGWAKKGILAFSKHAPQRAELSRSDHVWAHGAFGRGSGGREARLAQLRAQRHSDRFGDRGLLWFAESFRRQPARGIPGQGFRGSEATPALRSPKHHQGREADRCLAAAPPF